VFLTPSRLLLGVALTGVLALIPARMLAQGTPTTQTGQKEWKDRAEYDLYDAITKDTNPATKLQKLDQWKSQYPTTAFIDERRALYLNTYTTLGRAADAVAMANEILAANPKDFTARYYVMYFTQALASAPNAPPEVLNQGEQAANSILAGIDTPPPNVTDDAWKGARKDVEALAHTRLGWIAMQRKNWQPAEDEFKKALAINPNNGDVDYWMGTVIVSQKNPDKQADALFYFARAAAYDGPGALNPEGRKTVLEYVQKAYKNYHGSAEGFDQLLQLAKANTAPPAGFKIVSAAEIAKAKADAEAAEAAKNPSLAIWKSVKEALTGADGANYFKSSMEGSLLPELTGKVVSIEPAVKPKTVVLAISDPTGKVADATLKFETALPGKVEPGTVLSFQGVPVSYAANPFMVTFTCDKEHLKGWTGTAAAVRKPPVRGKTRKR
jgi:tetratricopeptide (TPR) repeat protein